MAYRPEADDPFSGGVKVPSLSWKDAPVGTIFSCEVLEPAKLLHSRNYETNQPDYWDPPANTNPKMSAVINVLVLAGPHSVGEQRSIWAQRPSNLFAAIAQAQQDAGARIAPGGKLHLKFTGETPHQNKRNNPIKNYAAKYEPGQPAQPDPFVGQAPQYASQAPQYAQAATTTAQTRPPTQTAQARPQPVQEALPGTSRRSTYGEAPPF